MTSSNSTRSADERTALARTHKAFVELRHGATTLSVPRRRVHLTNGESLDLYDTSGPQGHDARAGLPALRAPWIAERLRSGADDGQS